MQKNISEQTALAVHFTVPRAPLMKQIQALHPLQKASRQVIAVVDLEEKILGSFCKVHLLAYPALSGPRLWAAC